MERTKLTLWTEIDPAGNVSGSGNVDGLAAPEVFGMLVAVMSHTLETMERQMRERLQTADPELLARFEQGVRRGRGMNSVNLRVQSDMREIR